MIQLQTLGRVRLQGDRSGGEVGPASAQPKRLVLTHVYPQLDREALPDLIREAGWNGETVIASDGLTLEVGFG